MVWFGMIAVMTLTANQPSEREAILEASRAPVTEQLGRSPRFVVRHLARAEDWAFLFADMQGEAGKPFDYTGTSKAEAARRGLVSKAYAALLRRRGDRWHVVEAVIGPTDVAWEDWARKHGAPASLFVLAP